jgi:hypothetical protein
MLQQLPLLMDIIIGEGVRRRAFEAPASAVKERDRAGFNTPLSTRPKRHFHSRLEVKESCSNAATTIKSEMAPKADWVLELRSSSTKRGMY